MSPAGAILIGVQGHLHSVKCDDFLPGTYRRTAQAIAAEGKADTPEEPIVSPVAAGSHDAGDDALANAGADRARQLRVAEAEALALAEAAAKERARIDEKYERRESEMASFLAARDAARRNVGGVRLTKRQQKQAFRDYLDTAFPKDPRIAQLHAKWVTDGHPDAAAGLTPYTS